MDLLKKLFRSAVESLGLGLFVDVTQEDIDRGRRYSVSSCPIAQAVRRKDQSQDVWVRGPDMTVYPNWGSARCFRLPMEATNFVICFDHKDEAGPVSPISFFARRVRN